MELFSLPSAHRQNSDKKMLLTASEKILDEEIWSTPTHSSLGIFLSLIFPSAIVGGLIGVVAFYGSFTAIG